MRSIRGLVAVAFLCGIGGAAGADEPAPRRGAPLEIWLHDVSALTAGIPTFDRDGGPLRADLGEARPLFEAEGEEVLKPLGPAPDIVEMVKAATPAGSWSAEGVLIMNWGERYLLALAPRGLQEAVARTLVSLARDALPITTYDVAVLRGDPDSAAGQGGLPAAVARGALAPLGAARASGFVGGRILGRQGGQSAFLGDYDVLVAEDAKVSDPRVAIQPDGLGFSARTLLASADRVRVNLDAWWAQAQPMHTARTAEGDVLEVPATEIRQVAADLDLRPGDWTTLPSTGGVVFAVRASVHPYDLPEPRPGPLVPRLATRSVGPLQSRAFDIGDLGGTVPSRRGLRIDLVPSKYAAPEFPDLPEPVPVFPVDSLVDIVKRVLDEPSWVTEGTQLEVRPGHLLARTDDAHLAAIEGFLAALRVRRGDAFRARATVVSVPVSSLPEYWSGLEDDAPALAGGGATILARPGARVVASAGVRLAAGQRNAALGGVERSYVSDYDVEIAQKATIGEPVVRTWFDGLSFDLRASPAAGGAAALVEIRLDRSVDRGSRSVPTRHGAIECPSIGLTRVRGQTVVPVGSTRLVAANFDGLQATLVLLTVNAAE